MIRKLAIALSISAALAVPAIATPPADAWQIGPIIDGRNYSVGMPLRPSEGRDGATFAIPGPTRANGHVHYVTVPVRDLEGAKRITLRYRIDAPKGTRFLQQEDPQGPPGMLSLFIQRRGDSWRKRHPYHRWYSPKGTSVPLAPGVHEISIGLNENWLSVMGSDANRNPREFQQALNNAHRVGFTFGGTKGLGHGVFATRPAQFTVLEFTIE